MIPPRRERRLRERQRVARRAGPVSTRRALPGWAAPLVVAGAIALLILGARAAGVFEPGAPPLDVRDARFDPSGQTLGVQLPDEGNTHIPAGQRGQYAGVPPASGSMWGQTAPWGIKDTAVPDETVIHNLEHGGVVISYKGLSAEELKRLKAVTRLLLGSGYPKIILRPYAALTDARLVVTAWRWELRLPDYDEEQLVKFVRQRYESPDAPEPGMR